MCGKAVHRRIDQIANSAGSLAPLEDVRPGAKVMVDNKPMTWGYEIGGKLVYNARSETYLDKSSFKDNKRTYVRLDGFYEGGQKFVPAPERLAVSVAALVKGDRFVILTKEIGRAHV